MRPKPHNIDRPMPPDKHDEESGTTRKPQLAASTPPYIPDYIFGLHEAGGEQLMIDAERPGWVLELAAVGLDAAGGTRADYRSLAAQGLGVVVRLDHGYAPYGTLPPANDYPKFARSCAEFVARSRGCHIWIVGNEPNHEIEWPQGRPIYPQHYAEAYRLCRQAIRAQTGHEQDLVLVAGPAPWNARLTYTHNPSGDWVKYFHDVICELADEECDGFALHTYTHRHDPAMITADVWQHQPGYQHLRNEFRSYRDFMHAIPYRFRHLPVLITETDPTDPTSGWEPAENLGWIQAAYHEIATWNARPGNQPIQALLLYRWPPPQLHGQAQWSIANRPGIIADFRTVLALEDSAAYRVHMPRKVETIKPATWLPEDERWIGRVTAPAGLRLRLGPSLDHGELLTLPFETIVEVLAASDDWLFVRAGGREGYVSRNWVTWLTSLQPSIAEGDLALAPERQVHVAPNAPAPQRRVAEAWNRYGGFILEQSAALGIDPGIVLAVLMAESQGEPFGDDGRMVIRFEPHIFYMMWGRHHAPQYAEYFSYRPDQQWNASGQQQWRPSSELPWRDIHADQASEWDAFELARGLDEAGAMQSISMGAPQIMGFNHKGIGYATVQEMFHGFNASARAQFESFFRYMQRRGVVDAVRREDFAAFARAYNGVGQEAVYAARMREWLDAYHAVIETASDVPTPSVLPLPDTELGASVATHAPEPLVPDSVCPLAQADPILFEAWRKHIIDGYANNRIMFERIRHEFMTPYRAATFMYAATFVVAVSAFVLAAILALSAPDGALVPAAVFGGLSAVAFLTFFFTKPLKALEENLQFITWLGIVYNTYWTRLANATDRTSFQQEVKDATDDAVADIQEMLATHGRRGSQRPGPHSSRT